MKPWMKISAVFISLAGLVAFIVIDNSASNAFTYSKLVHEVMENPDSFEGRNLRVEGDLRKGSVQFREEPCEWRFTLEKNGAEMPVRFPQCVVPDTFRDDFGISVTVEGQIQTDQVQNGKYFLADQVIPRCPSKYEMKEKLENGEAMPHPAMPQSPELQNAGGGSDLPND